ncbi:hypothetical protein E1301_Tti001777 [Triplophysa tibetana]|uniref:UPAR/Ly6 domain-containing protein n=1 Tax=Triplophysa tibetana TaxID=1572043 RepID=A0A5A9P3G9_9TELE|nr:hypothetical protein E1301_Tti001777 [Triplophysa tibetana]
MTHPRHGYGLYSSILLLLTIFLSQAEGLQCYACNIVHEQRYVDVGCSSPEVITCSHSHKGFKHRFCIRTESGENLTTAITHHHLLAYLKAVTNMSIGHHVKTMYNVLYVALGIMLTSGCATARHCHTEELPGVKIHCCGSDLCNSASHWRTNTLLPICSLTFALTLLY